MGWGTTRGLPHRPADHPSEGLEAPAMGTALILATAEGECWRNTCTKDFELEPQWGERGPLRSHNENH